MRFFFNHTLPTIDSAKSDHHLIHLISYSEELPEKYEDQLQEEAAKYSWVRLDKRTEENRVGMSVKNIVRKSFPPGTVYGNYRLDDDDVLATNYFEQAGVYLDERHAEMIVSLGYGVLALYEGSRFVRTKGELRPKVAAGFLKICQFTNDGRFRMPTNISHTYADRENPVILDSRQVSFLRALHVNQDMSVANPNAGFEARMRKFEKMPEVAQGEDLSILFPTIEFSEA